MNTTPRPQWYQLYEEDLERFPRLRAALDEDDPIGSVARQAKLSEVEARILRMWAEGASEREICVALGRVRPVVERLLLKGKYKILLWLVRAAWLQPDFLLVGGPMSCGVVADTDGSRR